MAITKKGAQSLPMKMKEGTVIYLWLSPTRSKMAPTSVTVGKTRLFPLVSTPSTGANFQLVTPQVSDDIQLLKFTSLR